MNLVVTTDFSAESRRVLPIVRILARRLDARVTVLHVVQEFPLLPGDSPHASPLPAPAPQAEREQARRRLEAWVAEAGKGLAWDVEVVLARNVPQAIAAYVNKGDADLLVMATHGRSGLRRLVTGSVTEMVVRHSHVPVVCVPPPAE
jgi:nucleotide-binding universal stress UspA family protein